MQNLLTRISLVLCVLALLPQTAFATVAADALRVNDDAVVSRGDFIRAAIEVLNLQNTAVNTSQQLPYLRVPSGLETYVRIAHSKGALEQFGTDLTLAQGISRGDALQVVARLTGMSAGGTVSFTDVRAGTKENSAVVLAIDRGWMEPLRDNLFGVRRMLTGREGILLLRKITGEEVKSGTTIQTEAPKVKFTFETQKRLMNLPKTQLLESVWSILESEYLYTDNIDIDEAAWKAAEALVESLNDKYSTFMRPSRARDFFAQIHGVVGIGAQVEYVDNKLMIVTPIVGSPAEAAGLLPGDIILMVNGDSLEGLNLTEAVDKVRGPKGTVARLKIYRSGVEFEVEVIRDDINIPETVITWQGNVAIIKLAQFGSHAEEEIRPDIEEVMAKLPKGIVLDLRKNPGGLMSAASSVISAFVPKGSAFVQVHTRKEEYEEYTSRDQIVPDTVPVVVLIDEGSASASEITAGALRELRDATIVGAKSFGKGTVQQVLQFDDQSSLKVTIAEWFTPNGIKIDGIGILPDIGVSSVDGRDAPLLKALDILR